MSQRTLAAITALVAMLILPLSGAGPHVQGRLPLHRNRHRHGHGRPRFGLAWYEQKRDGNKISFVEHMIMGDFTTKNAGDVIFTEPHATAFADMNGDGMPDIVTSTNLGTFVFQNLRKKRAS